MAAFGCRISTLAELTHHDCDTCPEVFVCDAWSAIRQDTEEHVFVKYN